MLLPDEASILTSSRPLLCDADDILDLDGECQDLDAATSINIPKAPCTLASQSLSHSLVYTMHCVEYACLLSPLLPSLSPSLILDTPEGNRHHRSTVAGRWHYLVRAPHH